MTEAILKGYEDAADGEFIQRLESISSADLLAPVLVHFPKQPSHVLDVGAGTGRDAAWLASLSHTLVAVEPVDALWNAGIARHSSPRITWIKDALPRLSHTLSRGDAFDVILLSAVWQHLEDRDRRTALSAFRRLMSDGGKLVMSIRHGAGAPTRPIYPADVSDTVNWAGQRGFVKLDELSCGSVQAGNRQAGVAWTWLVFQARDPGR